MQALSIKKLYPVIHCIDPFKESGITHAIESVRIATENGADGIFLIGHDIHFGQLTHVYEHVRKEFPKFWVGVNFLDISSRNNWHGLETATKRCEDLNALWVDGMPQYKLVIPKTIQVFGGIAFKYIAPDLQGDALSKACAEAKGRVDVAVTSGNATGEAPSTAKIRSIRKELDPTIPLALASGITEENVTSFLKEADMFLVASSICKKQRIGTKILDYLVPEKVRNLADYIHTPAT